MSWFLIDVTLLPFSKSAHFTRVSFLLSKIAEQATIPCPNPVLSYARSPKCLDHWIEDAEENIWGSF